MASTNNSGAFKKMSQRAMWRGDQGQSQMLSNHGMEGLRHNLLRDTPTYKKESVGLNQNGANYFKNTKSAGARSVNVNTKIKAGVNASSQKTNKNLGSSILDSLK
jgi:hypothetical protein